MFDHGKRHNGWTEGHKRENIRVLVLPTNPKKTSCVTVIPRNELFLFILITSFKIAVVQHRVFFDHLYKFNICNNLLSGRDISSTEYVVNTRTLSMPQRCY